MRDRSRRLPDLFDAVLGDAGVGVVLGGIEMPGNELHLGRVGTDPTAWISGRP